MVLLLAALALPAGAVVPGDVDLDGTATAGDAAILGRVLAGDLPPLTGDALIAADLAPLVGGAPVPDGQIQAGDLVVLLRVLAGAVDPHLPHLDAGPGSTSTNPVGVSGVGRPGDTIVVYVDGIEQLDTVTVATDGTFQHDLVALDDGDNTVTVRSLESGLLGGDSNAIVIDYQDTRPHVVPHGTHVVQHEVWTRGTVGSYQIEGTLIVDPGVILTVQPGVIFEMANGSQILVDGTLRLLGTTTDEVVLTAPSQATAAWAGIDLRAASAANVVRHAALLYTGQAVDVAGPAALEISDTRIENFASYGIYLHGGATAAISRVVVDNTTFSGAGQPRGLYLVNAGDPVSITDSIARSASVGLYLSASSPLVTNSLFELNGDGIYAIDSSPQIAGTTLSQNSNRGIYLVGSSSPTLHSGCRIIDNGYGIRASGNTSGDPDPVVTGCALSGNTTASYWAENFSDPTSTVLDASGNWWGSSVAADIADDIRDATDAATAPVVDFVPFLESEGGPVAPGNFLVGDLPPDTVLAAGIPYDVVGQTNVPPSTTATVEAGAVLRFLPATRLYVEGTLDVAASALYPALFTSAEPVPASGDWDGIVVTASSTDTVIDGALLRFAHEGVHVLGASVTLRNSVVENWGRAISGTTPAAIHLENAAGSVHDNVVRRDPQYPHPLIDMRGIWISDGAPLIRDNLVRDADNGLVIEGTDSQNKAAPVVTGNVITENDLRGIWVRQNAAPILGPGNVVTANGIQGVYVAGNGDPAADPAPTISGNDIYANGPSNDEVNLEVSGFGDPLAALVVARGNWWGSDRIEDIVATIVDRSTGGVTAPFAEIGPWLDASTSSDGTQVPGQFLVGTLAPGIALDPATEYTATGDLRLAAGETLVVAPGTRLHFAPGARLLVEGTLDVQGTDAQRPLFDSAVAGAVSSDWWEGIEIVSSSTGSAIDFAEIVLAHRGVWVRDTDADVTHTRITEFGDPSRAGTGGSDVGAGIRFENAGGTIAGNGLTRAAAPTSGLDGVRLIGSDAVVDANQIVRARDGLRIESSTALVTANDVLENSQYGIFVGPGSSVQITTGNVIQANGFGIWVDGDSNEANNPAVVANGNDLLQNGSIDFGTSDFGNAPAHPVDATLNYWGTDDEGAIPAKIHDASDSCPTCPVVDFSPALDSNRQPITGSTVLNGVVSGTLTSTDTYRALGNLTVAAGTTLTLEAGSAIEFDPGTGLTVNGTLVSQGVDTNHVVLRLTPGAPAGASWTGVRIEGASADADIGYVEVHDAATGVAVFGQTALTASVHDSDFYDCATAIALDDSPILVEDNTLQHSAGSATSGSDGIYVTFTTGGTLRGNQIRDMSRGILLDRSSSPLIEGNDIHDNRTGIDVFRAGNAPTISGTNLIHANGWGIEVRVGAGLPGPVITGNRIYDNADPNLLTPQNLLASADASSTATPEVDARGNYWGTTVPVDVAAAIHDLTDIPGFVSGPGAIVGFVPFHDAMDAPVAGSFLSGHVEDVATPLGSVSYEVLGTIVVPPNDTLTVPQGAALRMIANAQVRVEGTLDIQGVVGNEVTFESAASPAQRGDWKGIRLDGQSIGSQLVHAVIQHATRALDVSGTDVDVTGGSIREFSEVGVAMSNGAGGTLSDLTIDNLDGTGTGIELAYSSPTVQGATVIRDVATGVKMGLGSNPTFQGTAQAHPEIRDTQVAMDLLGNGGAQSQPPPQPVVHDTYFIGNTTNLKVGQAFDVGTSQVLDFRNNYWGTEVVAQIRSKIVYANDSPPVPVDFSDFLDAQGVIVSGAYFTNLLTGVSQPSHRFKPSLGEDFPVSFDLQAPGNVTVSFYAEGGDPVLDEVWSQSGSYPAGVNQVTWQGCGGAGSCGSPPAYVPEGLYTYRIVASDALGNTGFYDPTASTSFFIARSVQVTPSSVPTFNPARNEFLPFTVTVTGTPVRLFLQATPAGEAPFYVFPDRIFVPGSEVYAWDGRRPDGSLVDDTVALFLDLVGDGPVNSVLVDGLRPQVTGTGAPGIEVKADPYLVYHSYEQEARVAYHLDQDAYVSVWLLPPGVTDPADPSAIPIQAEGASPSVPGDYVFTWTGHDGVDTNRILTAQEGSFSFAIRARAAASNLESTYLGVLQVRR